MRLMVDQSLAVGFIPIKTWQQKASLQFKPSVLESKLYKNHDKIFFFILTFAKPLCDNVLQPSPLCGSGCNTSYSGLANVNIRKKKCFILLLNIYMVLTFSLVAAKNPWQIKVFLQQDPYLLCILMADLHRCG